MTVGEAFFAYVERRRWPVLALVLGLSAVCVYLEGERKVSASIWEIFDKEHPVITAVPRRDARLRRRRSPPRGGQASMRRRRGGACSTARDGLRC